MKKLIIFLVFSVFLTSLGEAAEKLNGFKVSMQIKVHTSKPPMEMVNTSIMAGDRMRAEVDNPALGPTVVIQNGASSPSYMLIPSKKVYYDLNEMPFKPNAAAIKKDAAIDYKETKETKKIAGYKCRVLKREVEGQIEEICISNELKTLYQQAVSMNALEKQFGEENPLRKLGGYPLELIRYSSNEGKRSENMTMRVQKVEKGKFAKNLFEIPSDYKETEPPGMAMKKMLEGIENNSEGTGRAPGDQKDLEEMMKRMKDMLEKQKQQ